ncbi:PTS sugar transporter subunit IIA [Algimonas porphyrae]|uniref:PTS IIA-like nitrogen-regulatory protein PtsN n=1 Tax=Algimonas porphyrae TaxID=1128113 RepID=A0ABQ5V1E3_9PROT|nr:PTS sugar transporter subunit IIA [Algimonas porphyrae]GLQ21253.1 PTS IIA-like nitrogen-regulatory protein PtsN [Algimonas porphyrae]
MTDRALFSADTMICDLVATSPKQMFRDIARRLIDARDLSSAGVACRDIVAAAIERERLGSTGVGNGVALPHARIEGLDQVVAAFARLAEPIEFDAVDGRPVDLVCFLLAPADCGGAHLRALARVSRLLRRQELRQRLRAAPGPEALFAILSDDTASAAA